MSIAVGSVVTWRSGKSRVGRTGMPIGIANCRVLQLGESDDGDPAARIKLPPVFHGEVVGALIADLETG